MKNFKMKYVLFIISFLFSILFNGTSVYAVGSGIPDSSGVKPLGYVSCTLEDGSKIDGGEISNLKPKFTLQFDKNIVYMLVWEQNRKSVSMSTDDNANVAIDVTKIDDTVDFDHRQQVFVQPLNQLEPGKTYHIKVGPNLTAKNLQSTLGDTTGGKGIDISFKTKKQEAAQGTNTSSISNQNTSAKDTAAANTTNANSTAATNQNVTQKNNEVKTTEQPKTESLMGNMSNYWLDCVIGLLIIAWIAFEVIKIRKKGRSNKPQV